MIVVTKKKIIKFFLFLLFLLICLLKIIEKNNIEQEKTIQTNATPVSGHIVILDAGHGQPDGGAVGKGNISEEEINLRITLKLQNLLEQSGTTVILTRSDKNGIYDLGEKSIKNRKISDLKNRVKLVNSEEADICVSIHLNKILEEKYYGWQTFYQKNDENSKNLAFYIQNNLNYSIQKENKREILPLSR